MVEWWSGVVVVVVVVFLLLVVAAAVTGTVVVVSYLCFKFLPKSSIEGEPYRTTSMKQILQSYSLKTWQWFQIRVYITQFYPFLLYNVPIFQLMSYGFLINFPSTYLDIGSPPSPYLAMP